MTNIPAEIWALAEHQIEILQRRFPNYGYALTEYPTDSWLRVDVSDGRATIILVVSFSSESIRIAFPSLGLPTVNPRFTEEVAYSDPKFTDDMLSDILEAIAMSSDSDGHQPIPQLSL